MPIGDSPSSEHPTLIDVADGHVALPRDLAPMRPRQGASAFNSSEYVFELKWDGLRALASRDRGVLRISDRNGGDLLSLLPELAQLPVPEGAVLDGEVVVCDSRGRPSYDLLAGRLGPRAAKRGFGPVFVAFDLLYLDRRALIGRPLLERRRRLAELELRGRTVGVPDHLESDGEPFLEVVAEYSLEGIVAKRKSSAYLPGTRTSDWLKIHVTPRADVVLGGLVEDEKGRHATSPVRSVQRRARHARLRRRGVRAVVPRAMARRRDTHIRRGCVAICDTASVAHRHSLAPTQAHGDRRARR